MRPRESGHGQRLQQQRAQLDRAARSQQPALLEPRESGEVDGQQQSDGRMDIVPAVEQRAVGEGERQERQRDAAAVELPGQQYAADEYQREIDWQDLEDRP